jgi:hypothetical protein
VLRDGTVVKLTDTTTIPMPVVESTPTTDEYHACVEREEAEAFLAFVARHAVKERFVFKAVSGETFSNVSRCDAF